MESEKPTITDILEEILQNKQIERFFDEIRNERKEQRTKALEYADKLLKAKTFEEARPIVITIHFFLSSVGALTQKERTTLLQIVEKEITKVKEEEAPPPPEEKSREETRVKYELPKILQITKMPSMNGYQVHSYDTTERAARQFIMLKDGFLDAFKSYETRAREATRGVDEEQRKIVEEKYLNNFKYEWAYTVLSDVDYFFNSELSSLESKVWEEIVKISYEEWSTIVKSLMWQEEKGEGGG